MIIYFPELGITRREFGITFSTEIRKSVHELSADGFPEKWYRMNITRTIRVPEHLQGEDLIRFIVGEQSSFITQVYIALILSVVNLELFVADTPDWKKEKLWKLDECQLSEERRISSNIEKHNPKPEEPTLDSVHLCKSCWDILNTFIEIKEGYCEKCFKANNKKE